MVHFASQNTHRDTVTAGSSSSAAKAPCQPNKLAGEGGGGQHAYAEGGHIYVMEGGRFWPVDPFKAWTEWLWCASSPIPSTQERAREIRAVLDSTGYSYGLH